MCSPAEVLKERASNGRKGGKYKGAMRLINLDSLLIGGRIDFEGEARDQLVHRQWNVNSLNFVGQKDSVTPPRRRSQPGGAIG
jgi:hypothetical protein